MNSKFSNTGFFGWLWKHRIMLAIVQVVTVAAAYVFTMPYFIQPLYKSSAIVYPYNLSVYSKETPTEQLLQFFKSVDIKNGVIKDLGLIKHYRIDTNAKYWYTNLLDTYDGNVYVDYTLSQAVEINALDASPDTACLIVKDVIRLLNKQVLDVQTEKSKEVERYLKKQLDAKRQEMDSLAAISRTMSVQYGLLDNEYQEKEVMKSYYEMLASGKSGKAFDEVSGQVKNMEEKGEMFKEVNQHLKAELSEYDNIDIKYRQVVADAGKQFTFTNVVSRPFIPDKKTFPIRWMLTLLACVSTFMFSVLLLRVIEKMKKTPAGDK